MDGPAVVSGKGEVCPLESTVRIQRKGCLGRECDGVAVSVGGAKDGGQPALDFALEFQSQHGAEDMSARP